MKDEKERKNRRRDEKETEKIDDKRMLNYAYTASPVIAYAF